MSGKWQFFIDRGGTFTDIVARAPDGRLLTHKLLSEDPEAYENAAIAGIADLMRVPRRGPLPVGSIASVKMGTTVATNALLERKGDPVLLIVSEGFPRCARNRLPGAAQDLRAPHREAVDALCQGSRGA